MSRPAPANPALGAVRGRGALSNPAGRYEAAAVDAFDDGWGIDPRAESAPRTVVTEEQARSVINYNSSPDLNFDRSINPYRGCEHGCVYCYARPTHGYLGLSSGLDFETRLFAKVNAAAVLAAELRKKAYVPAPIALGVNTDAWQPIERKYQITRAVLQTLLEFGHPVQTITKSALVWRDLDVLGALAKRNLVQVMVSVTTLDAALARDLEPRTALPQRRLELIAGLAQAGVAVGVMAAPMIPQLNDHELEQILAQAYAAGARRASYVLLRLPHELDALFDQWLQAHRPLRASHVWQQNHSMRQGVDQAEFGTRMRGTGLLAELLQQRFTKAARRLGYDSAPRKLELGQFQPPPLPSAQLTLFGDQ